MTCVHTRGNTAEFTVKVVYPLRHSGFTPPSAARASSSTPPAEEFGWCSSVFAVCRKHASCEGQQERPIESASSRRSSNAMIISSITQYINKTYPHIYPVAAWGETSFFYNPDRQLPRGIYFATIKQNDGKNDRASNLDRSDVFRLNIGISKSTYLSLFGPQPSRPPAGGVVETGHDFTALDHLIPHPVYGWMSWVCVLNPSATTFETVKPLLSEAYDLAVVKFAKRTGQAP